jgi:Dcp1-like decapping family
MFSGAFFIYSRLAEPYYSIFINNRLHLTPLMEPIVSKIQLQEQTPFLLYRSKKNQIFSFWFYNKEDCKRIYNLLNNIIKKSTQQALKRDAARLQKKDDVDILSMLQQAQDNFNSTQQRSPPQKEQQQQQHQKQFQQLFIKAQPKQQLINNYAPDIIAPNVANFFAAAQNPLKPNQPTIAEVAPQKAPLQITQNNVCPSVDEIERFHRLMSINSRNQ